MSRYDFDKASSVWYLMHLLHKLNINVIMFIAEGNQGRVIDGYVERVSKTNDTAKM